MNEEPESQRSVNEVFLVMQGGGAKGIAHAGGLIAIEEEHLTIKGLAGTSAGSIAAALVAAGYSGRELADPVQKKHIFNRYPFGKKKGELPYERPTELFTPFGWESWLRSGRLVAFAAPSCFQLKSVPGFTFTGQL